jgi:hypothetical protein
VGGAGGEAAEDQAEQGGQNLEGYEIHGRLSPSRQLITLVDRVSRLEEWGNLLHDAASRATRAVSAAPWRSYRISRGPTSAPT